MTDDTSNPSSSSSTPNLQPMGEYVQGGVKPQQPPSRPQSVMPSLQPMDEQHQLSEKPTKTNE